MSTALLSRSTILFVLFTFYLDYNSCFGTNNMMLQVERFILY